MDGSFQDILGQQVHQFPLHQAFHGTGTVGGIVAVFHHMVFEGRREFQRDAALGKLALELLFLDVQDVTDIGLGERIEHDDFVDTVEELGPDRHLENVQYLFAAFVQKAAAGGDGLHIHSVHLRKFLHIALDDIGPGIGGHDEDGILEVHRAALVVREPAVVQHLQQHVKHVRVGFFDLVQQHHAVGFAAHGLRELAALIVSHISRRRTYQTGNSVPLLVFGHIDTGHHILVVEQEGRQRLGQLRLTHAGGTHEEEGADGALLIGKAGTVAAHGIGHGADGLVLAHDPLVQLAFHPQELFLLAFQHPLHGNARPLGHHFGNVFRGNRLCHKRILDGLGLGGELVNPLLRSGHLAVTDLCHLGVVSVALGRLGLLIKLFQLLAGRLQASQGIFFLVPALHQAFALFLQLFQFGLQLFQFGRYTLALDGFPLNLLLPDGGIELVDGFGHGIHLQTQLGGRLVHQVDGLVRQETAGDVPVGKVDGGDEGIVLDPHLVVVLVPLLQTS